MTQIDPLHQEGGPETAWTTVNTAEALPGVLTPLGWTFWNAPCELGMRGAFCDMGVLRRRDVRMEPRIDDRYSAAFCGRYVANVDQMRRLGDRMPGTSADAVEEQILGAVRPDARSQPSRRRYPAVMVKMPRNARRLPKRLAAVREDVDAWWREATAPQTLADTGGAPARFAEAMARYERVMRPHAFATMLAQALYDQVTKLARTADLPGLETRLITGYGSLEETRTTSDLWDVSRGALTLEEFLARHGYHGPSEGEVSSRSWREDSAPLQPLLASFAQLEDAVSPRALEAARVAERSAAEAELLAGLRRHRRAGTRLVLRMARRYIPLREVGKAAFLQTIDAARGSARALGDELAGRGELADPDDIFFFTAGELTRGEAPSADAIVFRRQRREHHLSVRLPDMWTGMPTPIPLASDIGLDADAKVTGLAVSPGVAEGVARVVTEPAAANGLEPGDVLVCETTDPSWASLFVVAAAVVIDIGGPLSHGAIVARELGIPCVINTRNGTRAIRTGDRVRVDGGAGTVEIL